MADYEGHVPEKNNPIIKIGRELVEKNLGYCGESYEEYSQGVGGFFMTTEKIMTIELMKEEIKASNLNIDFALLLQETGKDKYMPVFPEDYVGEFLLF